MKFSGSANTWTTPDGIDSGCTAFFFHGDSPAAQFECDHNRAEHYIGASCTASIRS